MSIAKLRTNKLLGGRPMMFVESGWECKISGKKVDFYIDVFGRYWMAESPWGWGRIRAWAHDYSGEKEARSRRTSQAESQSEGGHHGYTKRKSG